MENLKVKITAYKDHLVIETINPEKDEHFVPVGGSNLGSVLMGTDKILGMSEEAVALLKTIKRGRDCIGDVSTWTTTDSRDCFAWFGHLNRIVSVKECESCRDGIIDLKHLTIENTPPAKAIEVINVNALVEDKELREFTF